MKLTKCADTGANASAEGGDDAVEDTTEQKIDVVASFRLETTQFDKKSYLTHLKGTASDAPRGRLFANW